MSKVTQNYRLYELLKSASGMISKDVIASELGVAVASVPVYIHEFKKAYKADITAVRVGRNVVGYQLVTKTLKVPQFRKNAAGEAPPKKKVSEPAKVSADGVVSVLEPEASQVSDRELADVRSSLGIGHFGGGGFRSSDY